MLLFPTLFLLGTLVLAQHIDSHHHRRLLKRNGTCSHSLLATSTAIPSSSPSPLPSAQTVSNPPAGSKNLSTSSTSFTPNNNKAGIAGGAAYSALKSHIGWWYDWYAPLFSPHPPQLNKHIAIGPHHRLNHPIPVSILSPSPCSGEEVR